MAGFASLFVPIASPKCQNDTPMFTGAWGDGFDDFSGLFTQKNEEIQQASRGDLHAIGEKLGQKCAQIKSTKLVFASY